MKKNDYLMTMQTIDTCRQDLRAADEVTCRLKSEFISKSGLCMTLCISSSEGEAHGQKYVTLRRLQGNGHTCARPCQRFTHPIDREAWLRLSSAVADAADANNRGLASSTACM